MLTRRQLLARLLALPFSRRPNIVLIVADDLAKGDLGCYGQRLIRTPNIDKLRAEGMLFSGCHSAAPVCHPTRWSLLTGYRPRTGSNEDTFLAGDDITLPELLSGYRTGLVGKWALAGPAGEGRNPWEVFDYAYGPMYTPFYAPSLFEDGAEVQIPENQGGRQGVYIPDLLQEKALEFIGAGGGPFFLLYTPYPQHIAGDGSYPVPDNGPYEDRPWSLLQKNFAGTMHRLDSYVGQIKARAPANTIILFTSDNGAYIDEAHSFFDRGSGLRGGKKEAYQGGLNVPLLAWWPGMIPAGSRSGHICVTYDLFATILELAGLYPPLLNPCSKSLVPTLLARKGQAEHEQLYFAFYDRPGGELREAARWAAWKGVRRGEGAVEVYDLAADPGETLDLAGKEPEVAERLRQVMDRHCPAPKPCRAWLPGLRRD